MLYERNFIKQTLIDSCCIISSQNASNKAYPEKQYWLVDEVDTQK